MWPWVSMLATVSLCDLTLKDRVWRYPHWWTVLNTLPYYFITIIYSVPLTLNQKGRHTQAQNVISHSQHCSQSTECLPQVSWAGGHMGWAVPALPEVPLVQAHVLKEALSTASKQPGTISRIKKIHEGHLICQQVTASSGNTLTKPVTKPSNQDLSQRWNLSLFSVLELSLLSPRKWENKKQLTGVK